MGSIVTVPFERPIRLRLASACGTDCALCAGATIPDAQELAVTLEHAKQTGRGRIYLQGVDLAGDPNLPAMVRSARSRSLEVALVEDGQGLDLPDRAGSLRKMEIGHVYLSLPSAAVEPIEASTERAGAWKEAWSILLALTRTGQVVAGAHVQLSRRNACELGEVVHLHAQRSIAELLISDVLAADEELEPLDAAAAVDALDQAWRLANARHVRLRVIGFDRTRHAHVPVRVPAASIDLALLELIRRGIPLPSSRAGVRALGAPDQLSGLRDLASDGDELRNLGLELAASGCPFVDLPPCLGGVQLDRPPAPDGIAETFTKSDACHTCAFDERCPGAPERLGTLPPAAVRSALRPFSNWSSIGHPPRILILSSQGQDLVFYTSTLPGLTEDLRKRGATVEIVSPWLSRWDPQELPCLPEDLEFQRRWEDLVSGTKHPRTPTRFVSDLYALLKAKWLAWKWIPDWTGTSGVEAWLKEHDLGAFDLVISSDFETARLALKATSPGSRTRIVLLDFHMLKGIDDALAVWSVPSARAAEGGWWPSDQLLLESGFPGYVRLYLNYGVPLEHVAWRPFPLYPGHFPPGPDVQECRIIMSGGTHLRDLGTLRAATERLPRDVRPVVLFDRGKCFDGNTHLLHEGAVPLRSFYHALANSRFVVVPLREDTHRAAGVTVLAMALMAGRPVVATGIAAVRDYVQHGVEGLLVPPSDSKALADAITRLDRDAALLSALAAGAREAGRQLSTASWAEQIVSRAPVLGSTWTDHRWRNW